MKVQSITFELLYFGRTYKVQFFPLQGWRMYYGSQEIAFNNDSKLKTTKAMAAEIIRRNAIK
jgi:hypothetical protein